MEALYDITDDIKRDVLSATDLVHLIGATTSLKKAGTSWKGLCPFHTEKTPSFHVHPQKGFYYCFGCGAKGDAITFVRETERLEFAEAVAYLARLAGISLPMRKSGSRVERAKDTRANEAISAAARFFAEQLPRHAAAGAFLEKRGLSMDEARRYGFGAAPESWDALRGTLSSFGEELLLDAGLLQKNPDTGRVYDRFRNRLTVEIRDARGEVLGFGARSLGDDQPKYLNSPESARFSKGRLLYGLDRAKEAIRTGGVAILVEGYFDRIAFERAGLPGAVASMGTSLTAHQAELLARHAGTIVVAYDGDEAGQAASRKAFALLLERGTFLKHLRFPPGHDPDSLLKEQGADALRQAFENAVPIVASLLDGIPPQGGDPALRTEKVTEAVAILSAAPERIARYELLSELSRGTGIPVRVLAGDGKKTGPRPVEKKAEGTREGPPGSEERVLRLLLRHWPESGPFLMSLPPEIFELEPVREIFLAARAMDPSGGTLDFLRLTSHLGADAERLAARLLSDEPPNPGSGSAQNVSAKGGPEGLSELHKPLLQLKIRQLERTQTELQGEIAEAARNGDADRQLRLSREKNDLVRQKVRLTAEWKRAGDEPGGTE